MSKLLVFVISCLCILGPEPVHGWFSTDMERKSYQLPFECAREESATDTYVLRYDGSGSDRCGFLLPEPEGRRFVCADRINIDIPVGVLLQESVNPVENIDRLVAVNLRIQKLLDEYLAQTEKYEKMLEGLGIPYLENQVQQKGKNQSGSIDQKKVSEKRGRLKKSLINTVKYHQPVHSNKKENLQKSAAVLYNIKKREGGSGLNVSAGENPASGQMQEDLSRPQAGADPVGGYQSDELPWFFSFALSVFKYCMSHKTELVFWAGISFFLIFFAIAMKARQ